MNYIGSSTFDQSTNPFPLGIPFEWWRPVDNDVLFPIPSGCQKCDGSLVTDPESLFYGTHTPDKNNSHSLGCDYVDQGTTGGSDSIDLSHGHYYSHGHAIPTHDHPASDGRSIEEIAVRSSPGSKEPERAENIHSHPVYDAGSHAPTTGTGDASSSSVAGVSQTYTKHPAYMQMIYLIRIK